MKQNYVSTLMGLRTKAASRLVAFAVALASVAAIAVIPGWEFMLGCLGFLGLLGLAPLVEVAARRIAENEAPTS